MDPDRWRRIEELCHAAAARPAGERAAFLAAACGDDVELRREVESLLAEESRADQVLGTAGWRAPALAPGTRLGPHEILGLIGAGGMGEVYKARDTRLDRTVAIKILAPELASDPDRRARFAREAKSISALNHPHICTLHDIGEADLPSPQSPVPSPISVSYLVMEYLEGETLAARLARAGGARRPGRAEAPPLPVEEALRIGAEIAEALAAAHKRGVVHRDLKPGNVMLVRTGAASAATVKLLDFGLAKLKEGFGLQASGHERLPQRPNPNPSPVAASSLARSPTWRPSNWRASPPMRAPTSGRSARSSTRCWRARGPSTATARPA